MTTPSAPARRLRRVAAGTALAAFPLLLIAQEFTNPLTDGDGADFYAVTSASASAFVPSMLLLMAVGLLMAPAASGVLHQARDRGAALANAGSALLVVGGLGVAAEGVVFLIASALPGGDPAEMAAFMDRLSESSLTGIVWTTLMVSWALGLLILPWAARRAGTVHWWVPTLATIAVVAEFGLPFRSTATELGVFAALAAAYGTIGLRVLRATDAEWDGVPPATRNDAATLPA
jgi:hypothetical protein